MVVIVECWTVSRYCVCTFYSREGVMERDTNKFQVVEKTDDYELKDDRYRIGIGFVGAVFVDTGGIIVVDLDDEDLL